MRSGSASAFVVPSGAGDVGGGELLEPRDRSRRHARKVGVDDQAGAFGPEERSLHRRSLAAAGIEYHARPERTSGRSPRSVVGDEAHVVVVRHRRLEHVAEHRERELDAEGVREPALPAQAEGDDDRCHPESLRAAGRLRQRQELQAAWLEWLLEAPGPVVAHS